MTKKLVALAAAFGCAGPEDGDKRADDSSAADDGDGDGFSASANDCNDADASINPGAVDQIGDAIDNNCDGVDGVDADGDGSASTGSGGTDCADDNSEIPTWEVWNGVDDNCDGCVDNLPPMLTSYPSEGGEPSVLVVSTLNGDPGGYSFGLAETGRSDGWFGEDCIEATRCHTFRSADGDLSVVAATADVVLSQTTHFNGMRIKHSTWMLRDSRGACAAYGEDPSYDADIGCCTVE